MNLNSRLFDKIRVKPEAAEAPRPGAPRCNHPGCREAGEYRAPMGRLREGEYFRFCLDHVREYNATYNYFNGMSDNDVASYQRDAVVGHRPTWSMGVARNGRDFREDFAPHDPFGAMQARAARRAANAASTKKRANHTIAALKALDVLGLDAAADAETIRARYKELVKRLHPDANGGDRANEDRLREIIHAYKQLKSARLV
jgi:curved DNA-binding protein CbpA